MSKLLHKQIKPLRVVFTGAVSGEGTMDPATGIVRITTHYVSGADVVIPPPAATQYMLYFDDNGCTQPYSTIITNNTKGYNMMDRPPTYSQAYGDVMNILGWLVDSGDSITITPGHGHPCWVYQPVVFSLSNGFPEIIMAQSTLLHNGGSFGFTMSNNTYTQIEVTNSPYTI